MLLEELLKKYAEASYDEKREAMRLEDAQKAFNDLKKEMLKAGYSEKEAVSFVYSLVRIASGSDHEADEEEYNLFVAATGLEITTGEFYGLIKHGFDKEFVDSVDQIVDSLSHEAKDAALRFVACFLFADKEISDVEREMFKKLEA